MADGDQLVIGKVASGEVATENSNATTLCSYTPPADCSVFLRGRVIAQRDTPAADCFGAEVMAVANVSGTTCTVQGTGTPTDLEVDDNATGWVVTFDASGQAARLRVTGSLSENVQWAGSIELVQVEATVA